MVPYLERDLTPGHENVVRRIDGEPYGLVICRDMFFTGLERAYSRLGVAALLVPAWDFYVDAWWASRSKRWRKSGEEINRSGNTFTATSRPRRVSRARYTSPIPPAPSGDRIS